MMSKPTQKDLIPGTITPNGVVLETHEMATVVFLTEMGYDIELIPKSNIKGIHTPDIRMSGREWEMKSPKGEGKWLIKNTFQAASRNIRASIDVFDKPLNILRRARFSGSGIHLRSKITCI